MFDSAKQKLKQSKYHFEKMRTLCMTFETRTESNFELDCFLTCAQSVIDYMGNEYNSRSSAFKKWLKDKENNLNTDLDMKSILSKRITTVHRYYPKVKQSNRISVDFTQTRVFDASGNEMHPDEKGQKVVPPDGSFLPKTIMTSEWHFIDNKTNEHIISVAEKTIQQLDILIKEGEDFIKQLPNQI